MTVPRVLGVSRVADNNRVISLSMSVEVTDDELRDLHDYLREWKPEPEKRREGSG